MDIYRKGNKIKNAVVRTDKRASPHVRNWLGVKQSVCGDTKEETKLECWYVWCNVLCKAFIFSNNAYPRLNDNIRSCVFTND